MEVGRRGWDPSDPEPCPQAQPPQPGGTQTCSLRNEGANPTLCCQLSPAPEAAPQTSHLETPQDCSRLRTPGLAQRVAQGQDRTCTNAGPSRDRARGVTSNPLARL